MFNFSGSEIVFLLLLALIVLGPEKLPEAVRKFGKTYGEFKKMTTGFQSELKSALDEPMREMRETADAFKKAASLDFDADADEEPAEEAPDVKPAQMKAAEMKPVAQPTNAPPATASPATFSAAPPLRKDPQDAPHDAASTDDTTLRPDPQAAPPVEAIDAEPATVQPIATGLDAVVVRDAPVSRGPTKVTPSPNTAAGFRRAPRPASTSDAPADDAPVDDSPNGEQGAASA